MTNFKDSEYSRKSNHPCAKRAVPSLERRGVCRAALSRTRVKNKTSLDDDDLKRLSEALPGERKKWFVVFLIKEIIGNVPKRLYAPVIRAAVYEDCPSSNRSFVEPCVKTFGHRKVNEAVPEYVETGTNREKAGAVRALYRAGIKLEFTGFPPTYAAEYAMPESKAFVESLSDVIQKKRNLFLREFIENEDLDVRRSIIPSLKLNAEAYSEDASNLIEQAVKIARASDDECIRHRVEVQPGNENFFKPLPDLSK